MRSSTSPQFLISGQPKKAGSFATALLGPAIRMESYEWEDLKVPVLTATVQTMPNMSAVREFCDEVSTLGAIAVMVEELEGRIQHITTFLAERSPELEDAIYQLEASILQQHPEIVLDFHVRATPRDENGVPELPDGPYYLLTWRAA